MRPLLPGTGRRMALVLLPAVVGLLAVAPARADGWHHGPGGPGWHHGRGGPGWHHGPGRRWHRGPWGRPGYYHPPPVGYGPPPPPPWGYGPPPPPVVYGPPPPPLGGLGLFFNFR